MLRFLLANIVKMMTAGGMGRHEPQVACISKRGKAGND
jgi:hypothetical protein